MKDLKKTVVNLNYQATDSSKSKEDLLTELYSTRVRYSIVEKKLKEQDYRLTGVLEVVERLYLLVNNKPIVKILFKVSSLVKEIKELIKLIRDTNTDGTRNSN
jgi:hypothetical protein